MKLEAESTLLARELFGVDLPEDTREKYALANKEILAQTSPAELAMVDRAIESGADLEALEFALRLRNRGNLLSRKAHVLSYLIETNPRFTGRFLNERPRRIRAYFALTWFVLYSGWKLLKGTFTIRRLGGYAAT